MSLIFLDIFNPGNPGSEPDLKTEKNTNISNNLNLLNRVPGI